MKLNKILFTAILSLCTTSCLLAKQSSVDSLPGVASQPAEYFYTGKPYDADLESYIYKFRNYDPKINRWTTVDPYGFPDGANNRIYSPVPTMSLDPLGLYSQIEAGADATIVETVITGWNLLGYTFSSRLANTSLLNQGGIFTDRTAPTNEVDALKASSYFTDVFNNDYFTALTASSNSYDIGQLIGYGSGDLHYSYGRVAFTVKGEFTWEDGLWSTTATFSFADIYDFDPSSNNPAIAGF